MVERFERTIGALPLTLEVGELAGLAGGAVTVRYGDIMLLATACVSDKPREGIDWFPLTVDFEERMYAAGKIPGSFFRREGRPSTDAILSCRLTDRPIRPLFPKGFRNDVQVIITVLSVDREQVPDVLGTIGASAALSISEIPFAGPISSVRIGYIDGEFLINPTYSQLEESGLDLIVAGTRDAVMMVEAGALEVPESIVLEAIEFGQKVNGDVLDLQDELIAKVGKPKLEFETATLRPEVKDAVQSALAGKLDELASAADERSAAMRARRQELVDRLGEQFDEKEIVEALSQVVKETVRGAILERGARPDGRDLTEIRPISCSVGIVPRAHASGLFSRGETQVLSIATLGSTGDQQRLDNLAPGDKKRFLHHYNFPSFSVGETRPMRGPGRREIGHGALVERALEAVLPSEEEFAYTIRLVSEVLSSNGSTSMASVCGSTLSLMDAGVPIKAPVAGIAMGLIKGEGDDYAILTDIAGYEDSLGDMDFKVAGTAEGITALQMDIKVKGITVEIMEKALEQAKVARLFILDKITETISAPRDELSQWAPRLIRIQIPVEKIGTVIGPGGRVIRSIIEETKCSVDVEDDGTVYVGSADAEMAQKAVAIIEGLTKDIEVGETYTGRVTRIMDFGAFVEIPGGKDGLVRIGELADYHVPTVEDVVSLGDEIEVKVIEIDAMGRINLSRRAAMAGEDGPPPDAVGAPAGRPPRDRGDSPDRPRDDDRPPREGRSGPPGRGGEGRGFGGGRDGGRGGPGGGRGGPGGGRGGFGGGGGRGGPGGGGGRGGPGGRRGPGGGGGSRRGPPRPLSDRPGPNLGSGPFRR
ncbi:MAG: polyribonucleotide nucleotidyltransferase [Chloroflexi bacterium]|nr:polyribonucleotide nucleotidyltransferase [Chloroflexota bacterium]